MPEKQWIIQEGDERAAGRLQESLNIPLIFCRMLVQRGVRTFEEARQFFRPTLSDLHDPFLMKDMDKATARLSKAVENREKILLYGDYDVDGVTSVAMMYSFLEPLHRKLDYYIPDRYTEGYGISMKGVEYARQCGASLIIAMDCGIQAVRQVERARDFGIDMIICDHHLPGEELPGAFALLDPKLPDCAYPYKELSGCGIAFKLAQAYVRTHAMNIEALEDMLDLVVISIAADIVPMTGENRTLAYFGLKRLNHTERPGLKALIEQSGRKRPLSISDIVFGLAPMINAAGRLADADQAVKLMLSREKKVAFDHARVLEHRNKLRKEFDRRMAEEARDLFLETPEWESRRSVVLYQPHWHKGVVGIVASRMVEQFHRPTIILTESNGMAVGSARSVRGFDIHEAIRMCDDLLVSFGGHSHAAGLTLRKEDVPSFQDRFEGVAQTILDPLCLIPRIDIAAELNLEEITPKFLRLLQKFAPFGPGNRNPVFVSRGVRDNGYSRLLKGNHLRLSIIQEDSQPFQGIAFGMGPRISEIAKGRPFDICYTIEENEWQGSRMARLVVKDLVMG
jgi:single-stranded-DNA-specific exonuclease